MSLGALVHFPQGKGVSFRVCADDEVTHAGYRGLGFADGPAELLDLSGSRTHRRYGDIVGDGLLGDLQWDRLEERRCRESPSLPPVCPQARALYESAVRTRLRS